MNLSNIFSDRISEIKASEIREIFKLLGQRDIISLAGGNPAPETFPADALAEIAHDILKSKPDVALQYNVTEGYAPLRTILSERMKKIDSLKEFDDIIVTTGAQQAIDLTARILINEGDGVVAELPSFVGSLNSIRGFGGKLFGVPVLNDGMDLDALENILKTEKIKLIYTIPTFQNPTGVTMTLEKRKKLLELATKYNAIILEDNPYGELRFSGEYVPTIKSLDSEGRVIYSGSFSKILSSGMRVGWLSGHKDIIAKATVAKQSADVHTCTLTQMMAAEYLTRFNIDEHINKVCELYGRKCRKMLDAMDKYFPAHCTYTRPEGGIFLFCTMPTGTDSKALLKKALEKKVAFVPGHTFMIDMSKPTNTFRLNYSLVPEDKIEFAIKSLSEIL
ncbi:MAG: PLP-dependent aminotransferase family protein [Clostridia bacterium]|nr:PLP-dependent aminotransferase family protein [Clostridia bacterium]